MAFPKRLYFLAGVIRSGVVRGVPGHSSISITLDTYSHVLPNMQEKAVAAMDAIFEGS